MGDVVTLAYVHDQDVAHSWHTSYLELLGWDLSHHQRVARGGWLGMRYGTGGLPAARNETVEQWLTDRRDADWLWWVDTDMGFAGDTVDRLLAASSSTKRPIVGALCFAHHETGLDGMGGYRAHPVPTLYRWVDVGPDKRGFTSWLDYPRDQLVRVEGTGTGCVLIHRSVMEKIAAEHGPHWYTPIRNDSTGKFMSEDLSFCVRAGALGFPVHVHTGIKTTHLKNVWLAEEDYERLVAASGHPGPVALGPAPADVDVDDTPPVGPALPG